LPKNIISVVMSNFKLCFELIFITNIFQNSFSGFQRSDRTCFRSQRI
jgi:hypothetical protein